MLSDEEKKALKVVNNRTERLIEELKIEEEDLIDEPKIAYLITQIEANKTLVNFIEKQSKEIERTNEILIWKQKHEEQLQKEIEELKNADLTTVYLNGFYDGEKKVEDKIKAKIEEYENKIKKIRSKKLINEPEDTINITRYVHYISVLQSLLEKE